MKNTDGENSRDSGVLSNPLSLAHSGRIYWIDAGINHRSTYGFYWLQRSSNISYSYSLDFNSTSLYPQGYNVNGMGFAVRCEFKLAN